MYSPFSWSLTHFVRTSGIVLSIVEVHTRTFLPLPIPLKTSKGFLICISLSPWPMYYRCKWSVQLALIVFFTSKCLRNEVIGSLTLSAEVISRSKTTNGTLKRTITFCPWDFCLRYYLDLSRSFFLYKVRHLWNVLWLKLVDVFIRHSLIKLMSRSIPLDGFYPWLLFHKDQDVWDTISMVH